MTSTMILLLASVSLCVSVRWLPGTISEALWISGVVAETRFQDVSFPSVAVFVALMLLLTANVHSTRSSSMREGIRCIARREALWIKKPFSVPGEDTKCDKDKTENKKSKSMYCRRNSLLVSSWDLQLSVEFSNESTFHMYNAVTRVVTLSQSNKFVPYIRIILARFLWKENCAVH